MKKIYRWGGILLSALLILSSCNKDNGIDTKANGEPLSVNFRLGGSAGTVSRAAGETHTTEEKAVKSLWAIAFNDTEYQEGELNNEDDEKDTFFKAIKIDLKEHNLPESDNQFSFSLGKEGNFQICFIANVGADLESFLTGLTSNNTVNDLKTHITSQACDDKTSTGMLMTSPFYAVKSSWTTPFSIDEVNLTRAMARIDVYNGFAGMTISKIEFVNRATTTRLYQGNATGLEEGINLETKAYEEDVNLVGNAQEPAGYTEKIYTYEQKANTGQNQGDQLPAIKITYTLQDKPQETKTHTVKLVYTNKQDNTYAIGLKRNHLYKVTFTRKDANINASLNVLDWNEGDEISLTPGEIGGGTDVVEDTGNGIISNPGTGGEPIDVFE